MRINEVERMVGITQKNIRFYEKEGLLSPQRSPENGYREYGPKEVETLKRIKLLRRLSIPIDEIRNLQTMRLSLQDVLKRHSVTLGEQSSNLLKVQAVCTQMLEKQESFDELNADLWLAGLDQMEKEGTRFMDVKQWDRDRKKRGSLLAALVFCLLLAAVVVLLLWAALLDPEAAPPLFIMMALLAIPLAGVLIALLQRLKEIEGGEEDVAAQY